MNDIICTLSALEDVLFETVTACLGFAEDDPAAHSRVRRAWPAQTEQGSQPGFSRADNVCFVRVMQADDAYTRFSEETGEYDLQADALRMTFSRCDAHAVTLVFYGPQCMEDARAVRDGLATDEIRRILRRKNLYPAALPAAPQRAPELFGGQWWDRCDLAFTLYERVRRERHADYFAAASAETIAR